MRQLVEGDALLCTPLRLFSELTTDSSLPTSGGSASPEYALHQLAGPNGTTRGGYHEAIGFGCCHRARMWGRPDMGGERGLRTSALRRPDGHRRSLSVVRRRGQSRALRE